MTLFLSVTGSGRPLLDTQGEGRAVGAAPAVISFSAHINPVTRDCDGSSFHTIKVRHMPRVPEHRSDRSGLPGSKAYELNLTIRLYFRFFKSQPLPP